MSYLWLKTVAQTDRARGILSRAGLPSEVWPALGGPVLFLPAHTRTIDVAKVLVLFPNSQYDHVAFTVTLGAGGV